jgi:hypothetical protein
MGWLVSFTPRPLYPRGKSHRKRKIPCPYQESNPGRPVRNSVTILTELPRFALFLGTYPKTFFWSANLAVRFCGEGGMNAALYELRGNQRFIGKWKILVFIGVPWKLEILATSDGTSHMRTTDKVALQHVSNRNWRNMDYTWRSKGRALKQCNRTRVKTFSKRVLFANLALLDYHVNVYTLI